MGREVVEISSSANVIRPPPLSLFETKQIGRYRSRGYKVFSFTLLLGFCFIWAFRFVHLPTSPHQQAAITWLWIGMFLSEFCFAFYWILTHSLRRNVTYQRPFKHRLSHRYEDKLPEVDIFVCTADSIMEPPTLVVNTVLSALSYNYPPEKLSVYLSDDGGSELTFYSLLEASKFSKYWIPFCKNFNVEPRAPEAYFADREAHPSEFDDDQHARQSRLAVKNLYEEMKNRIKLAAKTRQIPEEMRSQHKGFSEWNDHKVTKQDHQSIVQIISDEKEFPRLIYMAREKRPQVAHNFKAGAMNALIRVSSEISNAPFILNLDCDNYANNPDTILDALCFFMDENKGHKIAYVQFPQHSNNLTPNDIYGSTDLVINEIELAGLGGYEAALYCGTGCFHRRESLCGMKYSTDDRFDNLISEPQRNQPKTVHQLEQASKVLADCNSETGSLWGKEKGLIYGCPVEDIVTGLTILCRGWKSIYYNPEKRAFLGVAPTTLDVCLVQYKRWGEGMFQIFVSKYSPFIYGHGKIKFSAQLGYSVYLLWAPMSFPILYYAIVPPLCFIRGISLFPQVRSLWFIPFAYVFIAKNFYSIAETLSCGTTLPAWWNLQRMWFVRGTTSFFFAFFDTVKKQLGLSDTKFAITTKVSSDDQDVSKRYEQEIIEFGSSSTPIMFIIISTLALLNLFSLVTGLANWVVLDMEFKGLEKLALQIGLCASTVMLNGPVYNAMFIRKDEGSIPSQVVIKSVCLASLACLIMAMY